MNWLPYNDRRGAALITVLFIFMVGALVTMGILSRQRLDVDRTETMLLQEQALAYAFGAEELARQTLASDANLMPGIDYPGQNWARLHQEMSIENGSLTLHVEDLQGRFNLNALLDTESERGRFFELVRQLHLREEVASLIINAMGPVSAPRFFSDNADIRSVPGLTPAEANTLLPYVTALPDHVSVLNINTALKPVLKSYIPDEDAYLRTIEAIAKRGFLTQAQLNAIGLNTKGIVVGSHYFSLTTIVKVAGRRVSLSSLIVRDTDLSGQLHIRVISRDTAGV